MLAEVILSFLPILSPIVFFIFILYDVVPLPKGYKYKKSVKRVYFTDIRKMILDGVILESAIFGLINPQNNIIKVIIGIVSAYVMYSKEPINAYTVAHYVTLCIMMITIRFIEQYNLFNAILWHIFFEITLYISTEYIRKYLIHTGYAYIFTMSRRIRKYNIYVPTRRYSFDDKDKYPIYSQIIKKSNLKAKKLNVKLNTNLIKAVGRRMLTK